MKLNHVASLLQQNYTTVKACFTNSPTEYTYKVPLSLGVAIDDHCVVVTRNGPTVVQVVEVHDVPEIDTEAPYAYRWIADKVDFSNYEKILHQEEELVKALQTAKHRQAAQQAVSALDTLDNDVVQKLGKIE